MNFYSDVFDSVFIEQCLLGSVRLVVVYLSVFGQRWAEPVSTAFDWTREPMECAQLEKARESLVGSLLLCRQAARQMIWAGIGESTSETL